MGLDHEGETVGSSPSKVLSGNQKWFQSLPQPTEGRYLRPRPLGTRSPSGVSRTPPGNRGLAWHRPRLTAGVKVGVSISHRCSLVRISAARELPSHPLLAGDHSCCVRWVLSVMLMPARSPNISMPSLAGS